LSAITQERSFLNIRRTLSLPPDLGIGDQQTGLWRWETTR